MLTLFIASEYEKGDLQKNKMFQFASKHFYTMDRAGLTTEFYNQFFELFENAKTEIRQYDITEICNILIEIPMPYKKGESRNILHFSFASKMLHTIDSNKPIYDSNIARVFGFSPRYYSNPDQRLQRLVDQYQLIEEIYAQILKENLFADEILQFDERFGNPPISPIMKIDFLVWGYGRLLKKAICYENADNPI